MPRRLLPLTALIVGLLAPPGWAADDVGPPASAAVEPPPANQAASPLQTGSVAQPAEINFSREGDGTRVDLISTGWERMSDKAKATRGGYNLGWSLVLERFAGRFKPVMLFFGLMSFGITAIGQRGKFVRTSLGRMDD